MAMPFILLHIAIVQQADRKSGDHALRISGRVWFPPFDFLIPYFQFSDKASISSTMLPI